MSKKFTRLPADHIEEVNDFGNEIRTQINRHINRLTDNGVSIEVAMNTMAHMFGRIAADIAITNAKKNYGYEPSLETWVRFSASEFRAALKEFEKEARIERWTINVEFERKGKTEKESS